MDPLPPSPELPPPSTLTLNQVKARFLGPSFIRPRNFPPVPLVRPKEGSLLIPLVPNALCVAHTLSKCPINVFCGFQVELYPLTKSKDVNFRFEARWTGKKRQEAYNGNAMHVVRTQCTRGATF